MAECLYMVWMVEDINPVKLSFLVRLCVCICVSVCVRVSLCVCFVLFLVEDNFSSFL